MKKFRVKADPLQKMIRETVERDSCVAKPCIVCHEGTHSRGVFVPRAPEDYGAPSGKDRMIIYPLCELESQTPDLLEKIEDQIAALVTLGATDNYEAVS